MAAILNRKLFAWSFYDLANTIFSAIVLTAYFPLYFTRITGKNWTLGAASSASMILAGLVVPYLGTVSDRTGKTKKYLMETTIACIVFLFPLAFFDHPAILMLCFLISCFFYHASLVFYNALLPVVAEEKIQGWASGLGTGLGYFGVLIALPCAHWAETRFGTQSVFILAAILFFLFSLPIFFCVPERRVLNPKPFETRGFGEEWRKVFKLIGALPQNKPLLYFFLGNFLVLDALNSTIFWFMVYAREVFSPGQAALIHMMMLLNGAAFITGILAGFLTDRFGSLKIFISAAVSLMITLTALVYSTSFRAFVIVSCTGGAFAIAGIWTAGRKALVEFAPAEKLGQYFGLYGLTTKISIIGSLVFSLLADAAGFQIALWSLVIPAAAGTGFLVLSMIRK